MPSTEAAYVSQLAAVCAIKGAIAAFDAVIAANETLAAARLVADLDFLEEEATSFEDSTSSVASPPDSPLPGWVIPLATPTPSNSPRCEEKSQDQL